MVNRLITATEGGNLSIEILIQHELRFQIWTFSVLQQWKMYHGDGSLSEFSVLVLAYVLPTSTSISIGYSFTLT